LGGVLRLQKQKDTGRIFSWAPDVKEEEEGEHADAI